MDEDSSRRMSSRTRKMAPKMAAALASADNRTQAALARLEALENDNAGIETADANDDDEASLDEDDEQGFMQKRQSKSTKRKTRQAKALENAKKAPRTFLELIHEANLESLPPHVPSYLRAAVGPPGSTSRRHFCTVCGFTANYTCVSEVDLVVEAALLAILQLHFPQGMTLPNPKQDANQYDNA